MRILTILSLLFLGAAAHAQDAVLKAGFQDCVAANVAANVPIIQCVSDAQSLCTQYPPGEAAELACYFKAKDEWGVLLADLLNSFADRPTELQEVARIEAKYAVLRNLMNCDLRTELSLVGRDPEPSDQLAKAQCEAVATAASLTEVLLKSGTITRN